MSITIWRKRRLAKQEALAEDYEHWMATESEEDGVEYSHHPPVAACRLPESHVVTSWYRRSFPTCVACNARFGEIKGRTHRVIAVNEVKIV